LPSKVVKTVWMELGGDWEQAVARLSGLCVGLEQVEEGRKMVSQLQAQFPSLPVDVIESVWTDRAGDAAAVIETLSDICRASGEGNLDMRIWRETVTGGGSEDRGGGLESAAGVGGGVTLSGGGEGELAEAVLIAVFLTDDSVQALAQEIPFARETGDLELRMVVHPKAKNIDSFLCPFGDVVYIEVKAWGESGGASFANVAC
jgi:hypothetical protein